MRIHESPPKSRAAARRARCPRSRPSQAGPQSYLLRLYVTGTSALSTRALETVRTACEEHLRGRYDLEVIDLHQQPARAREGQVVATPTLVKLRPSPRRRFIGDLSTAEKVLFGLDLRETR